MDFKLETCHSDVDSGCVKCQPEWVQLFAELLGVVAPLWLRAKSAYGGGRGM